MPPWFLECSLNCNEYAAKLEVKNIKPILIYIFMFWTQAEIRLRLLLHWLLLELIKSNFKLLKNSQSQVKPVSRKLYEKGLKSVRLR